MVCLERNICAGVAVYARRRNLSGRLSYLPRQTYLPTAPALSAPPAHAAATNRAAKKNRGAFPARKPAQVKRDSRPEGF